MRRSWTRPLATVALPMGLVDIKVIAFSETLSGLKLVEGMAAEASLTTLAKDIGPSARR